MKREQPINIVFHRTPGHESGWFIHVELDDGSSISVGEWIERPNGLWALRITQLPQQDATANEIDIRERHTVYRDELIKQLGETATLCKFSDDKPCLGASDHVLLSIADSFTFLRSYLINKIRMEDSKP